MLFCAEVLLHTVGEGLIFGGIFAGDEDGFGGQAVFEGIPTGALFAGLGAGSGGELGVGGISC